MPSQLAREDYVALATFPYAAFLYALATGWLHHVHRVSNRPLDAKYSELRTLEAEAETLNRTDTFARHAKKRREITKLEEEIETMKLRRTSTRRQVILTFLFYFILFLGVFPLRYVVKNLGIRQTGLEGAPPMEMKEIVMVPHLFTSSKMDRETDTRVELPMLFESWSETRSLGYIVWYCFCLLSVRTIFHAFFPKLVPTVKQL